MLDEGHEAQVAGQLRNGQGDQPQQNVMGPPANAGNNVQDRNNPLGLLGRLFGAPNRFPNPAQGNVPNLNNQGMVNGQQPGIFINYQVQYQIPRHQNNNLPVEQLQQLPAFPGFQVPGGAWQPWPAEEGPQPQPEATPASAEGSRVNGPSSEDPPTSGPTETSSTQAFDVQDKTPSPREAAAQAALRRFAGPSKTKAPTQVTTSSTPSDAVNPLPRSTATTTSSESRPPQLIPLFDFNQSGRTLQGSLLNAFQVMPSPAPAIPTDNHATLGANLQGSGSTNIPSWLPPNLTEDQLARLDTLTRESIDERLRILEGVSTTLNNCIDDLLRLRSALPSLDPLSTSGASSSLSPMTMASADEASVPNNGKGKEKAEDIPED